MRIAVTGASGHIGSCLVRELIKRNDTVRVLVHTSYNNLDSLEVEIVQGSLSNYSALETLCKDVDVIVHLAAKIAIDNKNRNETIEINIKGTKRLLDAARKSGVKRFIHFSSIHAFQPHPLNELLDEGRPLITSDKIAYEFSKAESERLVLNESERGLDALILNPTAVIGPYDIHNSYLGQALRLIYKNKLPMLVNGGYNWVDVRDVVAGTLSGIENGSRGERYLLSGHYSSLPKLSKLVSEIKGGKTPKLVAPLFLAHIGCPFLKLYASVKGTDPLYTHQSLNILANSPRFISHDKATKEFGYKPRPLKESLKDTFRWYQENHLL